MKHSINIAIKFSTVTMRTAKLGKREVCKLGAKQDRCWFMEAYS